MNIVSRAIILPLILIPVSFILEGVILSVPAYVAGYESPWLEYGWSSPDTPGFIEAILMFAIFVPFYRILLINGVTLFVCLVVLFWNRRAVNFTFRNWLYLWLVFYSNVAFALAVMHIGFGADSIYPWLGYKLMIHADWAAFIPATAISSAFVLLLLDKLSRMESNG